MLLTAACSPSSRFEELVREKTRNGRPKPPYAAREFPAPRSTSVSLGLPQVRLAPFGTGQAVGGTPGHVYGGRREGTCKRCVTGAASSSRGALGAVCFGSISAIDRNTWGVMPRGTVTGV